MALRLSTKRISPLDLNPNLTIGVSFPLNEVNLHQGTKNTKTQIKTNLINLLLTEPGERLHLPNYGVGLKKLLFQQNINTVALNNNINHQIQYYLPQITLIDTESDFVESENLLYIKIIL